MLSIDQRIAIRIRGKRLALGLSEEAVAEAIGVTTETIAAYERGAVRLPPDDLTRLAQFMGVTLRYFML